MKLPKVQGDEVLHSRTRDLYEALALPLGRGPEDVRSLGRVLHGARKVQSRTAISFQAAVLQTLFVGIHVLSGKGTMTVSNLTFGVNSVLRSAGEGFRISPRRVGAALTSFGLTDRQRTNTGWGLLLDRKAQNIHELIAALYVDVGERLDCRSAASRSGEEAGARRGRSRFFEPVRRSAPRPMFPETEENHRRQTLHARSVGNSAGSGSQSTAYSEEKKWTSGRCVGWR